MKVGRAALDEDAIRLIEENNPEVDFDWTRILKGGSEPPEPRKQETPRREFRQRSSWPRRHPVEEQSPPVPVLEEETLPNAPIEIEAAIDELAAEIVQIPAAPDELPPTPAHARLGAEGVLRLRGRYAEILTRIGERVQDPVRQDELKAEAERLNPDSWVTDEEVRHGLEQYETVFESLRAVVGRKRRRRRRRGKRPAQSRPQSQPESARLPDLPEEDESEDGEEPGSGEL